MVPCCRRVGGISSSEEEEERNQRQCESFHFRKSIMACEQFVGSASADGIVPQPGARRRRKIPPAKADPTRSLAAPGHLRIRIVYVSPSSDCESPSVAASFST